MIAIMKRNTRLEDVWIESGDFDRSSRTYWEPGLPSSEKAKKQEVIDYFATLNSCGRGKARDSGKAIDLVRVLLKAPENKMDARRLTSTATDFTVEQVLYGLLRESPGTWSANALSQECINSADRGLKRKASSLPE